MVRRGIVGNLLWKAVTPAATFPGFVDRRQNYPPLWVAEATELTGRGAIASHYFARELRLSELGYSTAVFTSWVLASLESRMRRICLVMAAVLGFGAVVAAAEEPSGRPGAGQPTAPAVPPASGTSSSDLNRSGGVITPPADIDPDIKRHPPSTETPMPIIPPGGNPAVKPK
jgi:hypothetical protein